VTDSQMPSKCEREDLVRASNQHIGAVDAPDRTEHRLSLRQSFAWWVSQTSSSRNWYTNKCIVAAEEETDPEYVVEVAVGGSDSASFLDDDDDDMTEDEDSDEDSEVRISYFSPLHGQ
jgi:hypothetical protein